MMIIRILAVFLISLSINLVSYADELSLSSLLERVKSTHPARKIGEANIKGAEAQVSAEKTGYLPTLELNAVYTDGFPAGIINLNGIPGAAFRSGPAAGLAIKQSIWDFGRTSSSVDVAKADYEVKKAESEVLIDQSAEGVTRDFFECVRLKEQNRAWTKLKEEFKVVYNQVQSFVRSGQRSRVEELLAKSQLEDAETRTHDYDLRLRDVKQRISQILQMNSVQAECPYLGEKTNSKQVSGIQKSNSSLIQLAQSEIDLAQSQVERSKANIRPKLFALASIGMMQNESAGSKNYGVGVGLVAPLFDSFRNKHETEHFKALAQAKEARAQFINQQLDEVNSRYDENINSSRFRVQRLTRELDLGLQGLELAKKRYSLMEGKLVDLREAIRNVSQIQSALVDARVQYQMNLALKGILNHQI